MEINMLDNGTADFSTGSSFASLGRKVTELDLSRSFLIPPRSPEAKDEDDITLQQLRSSGYKIERPASLGELVVLIHSARAVIIVSDELMTDLVRLEDKLLTKLPTIVPDFKGSIPSHVWNKQVATSRIPVLSNSTLLDTLKSHKSYSIRVNDEAVSKDEIAAQAHTSAKQTDIPSLTDDEGVEDDVL